MFDRIKAKEKSKTLLRTRSLQDVIGFAITYYGIAAIWLSFVVLTMTIIINVVGNIVTAYGGYMAVPAIYTLILTITLSASFLSLSLGTGCIYLLFHAGMNRGALRMNRGDKNVRVLDIILAGDRLGRYIAITLWQILFLFLWNLPSIAGIIIALVVLLTGAGTSTSAAFAVILNIAASFWNIYITINKICQYYYAYCIAEDKRELAALECIRESSRLMVDHKWELFVTMLSFIGWDLIGTLPGGQIFVKPYKYLTYTSIYEQLTGSFKPVSRSHMQWLSNSSHTEDDTGGERVVEILSGEFAGATLQVKAGEDITIGRDPKRANVVTSPANTSISGLHCRIRYDEQNSRYIVIDYSSNGTYLNNEKLIQEKSTYAAKGSLLKLADGAMILRLS